MLPLLERRHRPTRAWDDEVDHGGGAAGQSRKRAALPGLRGRRPHERHFEVCMRIDTAGHDICAFGVEHVIALEIVADG